MISLNKFLSNSTVDLTGSLLVVWATNYFNRPSVTVKCLFCGKLGLPVKSCRLLVPSLLHRERSSEIPSSISQLSHYDYAGVRATKRRPISLSPLLTSLSHAGQAFHLLLSLMDLQSHQILSTN